MGMSFNLYQKILHAILKAGHLFDKRGVPGVGQDIRSMGYGSGNFKQNQRKQRKLSHKRKMKKRGK